MILGCISGRVFFQRYIHQNVMDLSTYFRGIDSCKLSVLVETDLKLHIFCAKLEEATLSHSGSCISFCFKSSVVFEGFQKQSCCSLSCYSFANLFFFFLLFIVCELVFREVWLEAHNGHSRFDGFCVNADCKGKAEFPRQSLLLQIAGQLTPVSKMPNRSEPIHVW